jgi:hypothetical protein
MPALQPFEFTARDAQGAEHHYSCPYIPTEEGIDISLWLLANLGSLVSGILPDIIGKLADGGSVADVDLGSAFSSESLTAAGSQWKAALLSPDARRILKILLRYGARDGAPLASAWQAAYQGNYGEMIIAAFEIIKANRFFSFPGMSPSAGT